MTYLTALDKLYPAQDIWCERCVNWHPASQWDEVEPGYYQCPDCLGEIDMDYHSTFIQYRPTERRFMMVFWTLWEQRDDDGLELLFALDANTVDENPQAWDAGCKAARDQRRINEADIREVIITINAAPIIAAFLSQRT